jgi:hypothetical protein
MTALRFLAVRISGAVVRWASPGRKEWAEGLEREVAFIESDWRALVWAMGSLRILLRWSTMPLASLSEVPCAARQLARKTQAAMLIGSAIALFEAATFSYYLVHFRFHLVQSTGSLLTAAGALWFGYCSIVRRARKVPCGDRLLVAGAYRAELARQRDFLTLRRLWIELGPLVAGVCVFCAGMTLAYPKTARSALLSMSIVVICSLAAGIGYRSGAAVYRRRIKELDAVIDGARGDAAS